MLANQGVDVNKAGSSHRNTALHYAAGYGEVAAVRALCEAGSDVNAADRTGMTPLHWACLKAHAPVVELLLNSKADAFVSATAGIFKGRCALDLADHAQSDAVREVLLTQLGASMFASHASYGALGLGDAGTDAIVGMVRDGRGRGRLQPTLLRSLAVAGVLASSIR